MIESHCSGECTIRHGFSVRRAVPFVSMSPSEREAYIGRIVSELSYLKSAKVSPIMRFPGVREAGSYEVDIAFEMLMDGAISFIQRSWSAGTRPVR